MLGAVCHGRRDLRIESLPERPLGADAGRFPHVQGGFAQHLILRKDQIVPVLHLALNDSLAG